MADQWDGLVLTAPLPFAEVSTAYYANRPPCQSPRQCQALNAVAKKLADSHICVCVGAPLPLQREFSEKSSGHDNTYLWLITSHFLGFRICFCAYAGIWVCLGRWEFTAP